VFARRGDGAPEGIEMSFKSTFQAALFGAAALAGAITVPAAAAPVLFAGNGHYYDFITDNVSWDTALANAASAPSIAGYDSYLMTITSAAEDDFIKTLTGGAVYVWAAGSDLATEGVWRWVAGPEAGQIFWNNAAVPGAYSHWNAGEPNGLTGEHYLHVKANEGNWNDITATFPSGGYVIEYSLSPGGAIPEPSSWALMILGFGAAGSLLRRRRAIAA